MPIKALISAARDWGCRVTEQAPMADATTFHIGGPADLLIDLPSPAVAGAVIALCHRQHIPYLVIGNGSNLLVGDRGIRGAVLRLADSGKDPTPLPGNRLAVPAGMPLKRLCQYAREHGLTGLEFAFGIPGSVGGAVFMNAGAYDGCMADVVESVHGLTPDGAAVTLDADRLDFGYRHTALMRSGIIVAGVTVRLAPGERETIAARMKELMHRRQEKQPLEYPSAGSFFKRPEGHFAGALIEQTGLKGYRVGDAQVSEKHAGFVINRGHATAADICRLCQDVQEQVYAAHGVRLEPEVRFVGEF